MTEQAKQTILNFTENSVSVLIVFILFFAMFMAIMRVMLYAIRRSSPSSSNRQALEKSNKVPVAPKVTKSEIEESQLKRLAKEKENVK